MGPASSARGAARSKSTSTGVNTASRHDLPRATGGVLAGMSPASALLIAAVVAVAVYLLAALIFPERF